MKNSTRWILFIAGIGALILGMYYFINPSWLFWPPYSAMGWRPHHFGPRTFPWVFLLELLIAFTIGFALYKSLFPSSGSQSTREEEDVCPCCGREFQRSELTTGVHSEDLLKEKAQQ